MRAKRRALTVNEMDSASVAVARIVSGSALFKRSKLIACYLPTQGELDPTPLIEKIWSLKKTCLVPVLRPSHDQRLWFCPLYPHTKLIPNRFGIWEPERPAQSRISPWILDLVLTPLVAFDVACNRIGSGAGYYDRTFSFLRQRQHWRKPYLLGLAYHFQETPSIPSNPWDVRLNGVVTNTHLHIATT